MRAKDHYVLVQSLSDQHPVKRIAMARRKIMNFSRMTVIDRERSKILLAYESRHIVSGRSREIHFAQAHLDAHFLELSQD